MSKGEIVMEIVEVPPGEIKEIRPPEGEEWRAACVAEGTIIRLGFCFEPYEQWFDLLDKGFGHMKDYYYMTHWCYPKFKNEGTIHQKAGVWGVKMK